MPITIDYCYKFMGTETTLTVGELIAELSKQPLATPVMVVWDTRITGISAVVLDTEKVTCKDTVCKLVLTEHRTE